MDKIENIIKIISGVGVPFLITAILIWFVYKYVPPVIEEKLQRSKLEQEQKNKQIETQNELTRAVTAALEHSNVIIERNTQVIERNTEVHRRSQNIFERCTDSIDKVGMQVSEQTSLIQKTYTEAVRVRDKITDK